MKIILRLTALLPLALIAACGAKWFPEADPITSPTAFSFTDKTNVGIMTDVASDPALVQGSFTSTSITATNGLIAIKHSTDTTYGTPAASGTISPGDSIIIHQTAAVAPNTANITSIQAGSTAATFRSITGTGTTFTFPSTTGTAGGAAVGSSLLVTGSGVTVTTTQITGTTSTAAGISLDNATFGTSTISFVPDPNGGTPLYIRQSPPASAGGSVVTNVQITGSSNGTPFTVTGSYTTTS